MKRLTWILFILIPSLSFGQNNYFEGSITYKHELTSNNPNLDTSLLREFFGYSSKLFFKKGNYKHTYDGSLMAWDIYRKNDLKLYGKKRDNDSVFWSDCSKAEDHTLRFSFTPNKEKVLNIECDELIIYYKDRIETQYYNSKLFKLDPEWFKGYKKGDEYLIDQKTKSICLKRKVEYPSFTIIEIATSSLSFPIDDALFNLPPNTILTELK